MDAKDARLTDFIDYRFDKRLLIPTRSAERTIAIRTEEMVSRVLCVFFVFTKANQTDTHSFMEIGTSTGHYYKYSLADMVRELCMVTGFPPSFLCAYLSTDKLKTKYCRRWWWWPNVMKVAANNQKIKISLYILLPLLLMSMLPYPPLECCPIVVVIIVIVVWCPVDGILV